MTEPAPNRRTPTAAPQVILKINGIPLDGEPARMVESVSVDQARDKADAIKVRIANPVLYRPGGGDSRLLWTDSKALVPGQRLEVWARYEVGEEVLLGCGIIGKHLPEFTADSIPMLEIRAYDGATLLMDGTDEVNSRAARSYPLGTLLHEMVRDILSDYGFDDSDVAQNTIARPSTPIWKKEGMTDYAFIRGITAMLGYEFNVRWDPDKEKWAAVFRELQVDTTSRRNFTWGPDFDAGSGDMRLIEFFPRFLTRGQPSDVKVFFMDRDTRTWEEVTVPEPGESRGAQRRSFAWLGEDTTSVEADLQAIGTPESARGLRIKAAGTSIEVIPTTGFADKEAAVQFAEAWWRARQEMFIFGDGYVVGWPRLRPGQVHEFEGLGPLSGDWYIVGVEHFFSSGSAYRCNISARKVIQ